MIESNNFNNNWPGHWRSILGLTHGKIISQWPDSGGRYPAFYLHDTKKLVMSIFTQRENPEKWIEVKFDEWPSFRLFLAVINSFYPMIQSYSSNFYKTRCKMNISFSKNPDGVYRYSFNGNHEWHEVDHNKYALENMKLYIGGVTDLAPIGDHPTAEGYVKNVVLEEIFKPQSPRVETVCFKITSALDDICGEYKHQFEGNQIHILQNGIPISNIPAGFRHFYECFGRQKDDIFEFKANDGDGVSF